MPTNWGEFVAMDMGTDGTTSVTTVATTSTNENLIWYTSADSTTTSFEISGITRYRLGKTITKINFWSIPETTSVHPDTEEESSINPSPKTPIISTVIKKKNKKDWSLVNAYKRRYTGHRPRSNLR